MEIASSVVGCGGAEAAVMSFAETDRARGDVALSGEGSRSVSVSRPPLAGTSRWTEARTSVSLQDDAGTVVEASVGLATSLTRTSVGGA